MPASTSNLGAGFDCLGLALDLWLEARVVPGDGPPRYSGTLQGMDAARDHVARLAGAVGTGGWRLEIHSEIPVARGLGSSAAAVVAGLALGHLLAGDTPQPDRLFREAAEIEGHPDNAGPAVYGGLVLAAARPTRVTWPGSLGVALAIPELAIDTVRARAVLPDVVPRATAVDQARRAAALVAGVAARDPTLIAFGMDDRLAVPHRRSMIPGFDAAVEAGRAAGAFGVTISGSGSAVVALGPRTHMPAVASAMAEALRAGGSAAVTALTPDVTPRGVQIEAETPTRRDA